MDIVTNGRYVLGVGDGDRENRQEIEIMGVKLTQRGAVAHEILEVMHRLWDEEGKLYNKGRLFTVDGMITRPKPVTKPHPPTWIGAARMELYTGPFTGGMAGPPISKVPTCMMKALRRLM